MPEQPIILPIDGRAHLHIGTRSGRVTITAEERDDLRIESGAPLRDDKVTTGDDGKISITAARGGSAWLEIRCPSDADIAIGTVSGRVDLRGRFGPVRVTTVSGRIEVEQAETLDARSVTGRITVGRCSGRCELRTKSGRITCDSAGDASMSTLSGRIHLGDASGKVLAQSVSGKVEARTQGNDDVAIQTLSGSVRVEVPKNVRPNARLKSMTGRPRCDCEEGDDIQIAVRSMSGKIEVVPF